MRPEKQLMVQDIKDQVQNVPFVLLTDYTGMKVQHFSELRQRLRESEAEFRVVKNTLLKRALRDCSLPDLDGHLTGQTAVVLGNKDVAAAAKILKTFQAEFEKPAFKAAIVDRALLLGDEAKALADLPSRESLRSQILGLLITPAQRLVRILNTPAAQLAQVIKARSEKQGGEPVS
jgi:large subunit ribosomal protein L10